MSSIIIGFDAGARAEEGFPLGIAHFLEHACFKGTNARTYLDINREIAFLGGNVNAFTSSEMVAYYLSVPFENTEKAIEILKDMVFNSVFPNEEIIKEKEVVKEEELSTKDSVDDYVWNEFIKSFYSGRTSMPVIGTQESIDTFDRNSLVEFHKKFYVDDNAIVSLCSNHSITAGKALLNKYFGKTNKFVPRFKETSPEYNDAKKSIITRPSLEHAHVWMAYPLPHLTNKQDVAKSLMLSILGQGMDSRLFTEVREKNGLCYGINAQTHTQRDYSSILITSSTREKNIDNLTDLVLTEVNKMKNDNVFDEELERAKNKYFAQLYASLEKSSSVSMLSLNQIFFNLPSIKEIESLVKDVNKSDILDISNQLFNNDKLFQLICISE